MSEADVSYTVVKPGTDLKRYAYAGFWRRFWAVSVDFLVILIVFVMLIAPLGIVLGLGAIITWPITSALAGLSGMLVPLLDLKVQIVAWLYFALMESSSWQATIGKRLFGVRVMTVDGKPVTFARATGRYFGKYLSTILWMLGYVLAAFTPKKQALHDLIAETVVVRER